MPSKFCTCAFTFDSGTDKILGMKIVLSGTFLKNDYHILNLQCGYEYKIYCIKNNHAENFVFMHTM